MEGTIKSIFNAASEGLTTFAIGKELGLPSKTVYNIIEILYIYNQLKKVQLT